jgi:protein-S-isoprenylcysteine O-methyltransferase Ste14
MSTTSVEKSRPSILPPTYLLIALIAMIGLHFIFPGIKFIPTPWNLTGLLPLGIGIAISYLAEAQFQRVKTTVQPFQESSTLVTDGFFRLSRNPMYLGFVLILMGIAALLGTLTPFGTIPVFMIIINLKFIRIEEQMLEKTFSREYLAYCEKVRRWI